jgi:hypothetical protein
MTHAYRPPAALAATDFWMLSRHERTGQLLIPGRVVGIGLAAALLAELVAEDRIGFDRQRRVMPVTTFPPRDAVAHQVLDQLHGEDRLPVQVWLRHLAHSAYEAVAGRLLRQRLVVAVSDPAQAAPEVTAAAVAAVARVLASQIDGTWIDQQFVELEQRALTHECISPAGNGLVSLARQALDAADAVRLASQTQDQALRHRAAAVAPRACESDARNRLVGTAPIGGGTVPHRRRLRGQRRNRFGVDSCGRNAWCAETRQTAGPENRHASCCGGVG